MKAESEFVRKQRQLHSCTATKNLAFCEGLNAPYC